MVSDDKEEPKKKIGYNTNECEEEMPPKTSKKDVEYNIKSKDEVSKPVQY